ncbi:MAG: SDR family oxidoreductase [Rhodospirillales bacterium]|nr:SDR family oxidoreductase [Rhodospirillales bacterium]
MAGVLQGQVAFVTGAGSGIGEAIARAFAAEGAKVVVADLNAKGGERVATEINGLAVTTDVTSEPSVKAAVAACEKAFGRLDILVNNAGVSGPTASAEDMDADAWDALYAVNVRGIMVCTKHAAPLLKRQGGAILNMSSISGYFPLANRSCYGSSKFAVRGITESVAQELGPFNVRVNSLCPGATNTELFRRNNQGRADKEGITLEALIKRDYLDGTALGKLLEPRDIADVALYLASNAASAITGTHMRIDAGFK